MILVDGEKVSIVSNKTGPKAKPKCLTEKTMKLYKGEEATVRFGAKVKVGFGMTGVVQQLSDDGATVQLDRSAIRSEFAGMQIIAVLAKDYDILEIVE